MNDARETILINYPERGDPGTLPHLLDLYAHQLAESIRRLRDDCHYDEGSPEHRYMSGSADYIDPMVNRRRRSS